MFLHEKALLYRYAERVKAHRRLLPSIEQAGAALCIYRTSRKAASATSAQTSGSLFLVYVAFMGMGFNGVSPEYLKRGYIRRGLKNFLIFLLGG